MANEPRILVADPVRHTRTLVCGILRGEGLRSLHQATSADELLKGLDNVRPRIVIMPNSFPGLSGTDFTRRVRAGVGFVPRETSVILMVGAPTSALLEEARLAGVDEVLAFPFTTAAMLARVRSVLDRPRRFIDCKSYVGPCRRRLMLQQYEGPLRRTQDTKSNPGLDSWSAMTSRAAARSCVQKISEHRNLLTESHCEKLQQVYNSVMSQEARAQQDADKQLGQVACLIGRQMDSLVAGTRPDPVILTGQVDLLYKLVIEECADISKRERLIEIASQTGLPVKSSGDPSIRP